MTSVSACSPGVRGQHSSSPCRPLASIHLRKPVQAEHLLMPLHSWTCPLSVCPLTQPLLHCMQAPTTLSAGVRRHLARLQRPLRVPVPHAAPGRLRVPHVRAPPVAGRDPDAQRQRRGGRAHPAPPQETPAHGHGGCPSQVRPLVGTASLSAGCVPETKLGRAGSKPGLCIVCRASLGKVQI